MEVINGILIVGLSILLILFSRSITTLIHELGHAIPSLLFTKGPVVICLGSYADISSSLKIPLGRLTIYFKLNILTWIMGLCSSEKPKSIAQNMIITLGGPLASLLLGLTMIHLINNFVLHDWQKSIVILFIFLAIYDFFINIIPLQKALYLYDGSVMYNDGKQLTMLFKQRNLPESYFNALDHFDKKEYKEAKAIFESLINQNVIHDAINSKLIDVYIKLGEYDNAIDNMSKYSSMQKMRTEDNAKLGFIFYALGAYDKALNYYDNAIHYDYSNAIYLNGRGLVKEALEDYNGAFKDFKAAADFNEGYVDPIVSMGRIYFNMNHKQDAKVLLDAAIEIEPENADAHFYLGRYYDDKHETQLAYDHFLEAERLGCEDHGLDFYLANLKSDLINKS